MCTISDSLKLCTCEVEDVTTLANYWVLRRDKAYGPMIMGSVVAPDRKVADMQKESYDLLSGILNSGNRFDTDLNIQNGDTLQIHLKHETTHSTSVYSFTYYNNNWERQGYNPFIGANQETINNGEIENAFDEK